MLHEDTVKLSEFIGASKERGASDEFLASFLMCRGWPQEDVYTALGSYWEQATGIAVPERTAGGESSRDAFLYLLSFSTLATWSSALGSLLFRFIERWFPDPVTHNYVYNLRNAVTWQMASIAVAFPIFLLVMRTILSEAQNDPARLESGVRKWLTYIALLLTASAMICDLISFFAYFLTGELTSRFLLKTLTVMVICGSIFFYYLSSLHWSRSTNIAQAKSRSRKFGIGASVAVIICFCIGIGVAGTPYQQRHAEADRKRVQDLSGIADAVYSWHQRAALNRSLAPLPPSVAGLVGKGIYLSQTVDPETRVPYEYHLKSNSEYELCATFSDPEEVQLRPATQFWHHGKGRTCFTLDASQRPAW
ncbi:MAG TPA: DUF5671 domain-containing protein [Bryobacteraceae bacterium]|nr:DUF5671 domain-containing protein [Bryobacteraceae bacterium]